MDRDPNPDDPDLNPEKIINFTPDPENTRSFTPDPEKIRVGSSGNNRNNYTRNNRQNSKEF